MNSQRPRILENVAELRETFDQAFAVPAQPPVSNLDAFLAIRVAGRPFVLRVAELSRLEPSRKIVPLPGSPAALLGLAGIQGRLTPVYSLAETLGLGTSPGVGRWIAVCGREELLGLNFEDFEGFLQIPRTEIVVAAGERTGIPMPQAIRAAGAVRPIIHLPSILAEVRRRVGIASNVVKGP